MSLKMKLTSAIIMFMLAIATLVIGVLAAQTQSINMEGTINFEISDRSLYVKNVRLEDSDGTPTEITSFMPGYINDGITLSLGTHTVSNTSFKIHFDLINTTSNTYEAGDVTLSQELQSANVIASASGTISPTSETIPEGENYAPITSTTPISGTITLFINSPNTTSIDLSGITVAVDQIQVYSDFIFRNTSSNTGELYKYIGMDTEVVIPSSYSIVDNQFVEGDTYTVTAIADGVDNDLDNDDFVFGNLSNMLLSVVLPDTIERIGDYAFGLCSSLTSINIPDSVVSIGEAGLPLQGVGIGNTTSENNGVYVGTQENPYLMLVDTETTDFTSFTINQNCQVIGINAFANCTSLTTITIPASVMTIDVGAFSGCQALGSVTFATNSQLKDIASSAFSGCQSLTTMILPQSVERIGKRAFNGCTSLQYNTSNSGLYLGSESEAYFALIATDGTSFTTFTVDPSCQVIASQPFFNVTVTEIVIPASVKNIHDFAFFYSGDISAVNVDESNQNYTSEDGVLFNKDKTALLYYPKNKADTSYQVPSSVEYINTVASAGNGDSNLTSITIPGNVKVVSYGAFTGYRTSLSVEIQEGVMYVGQDAFGSAIRTISIPNSLIYISFGPFSLNEYANGNQYEEGLYIGNDENPYLYLYDTTTDDMTTFNVVEGCKFIGSRALYGCPSLTTITIPETVKGIGVESFSNCKALTTVNVDENNTAYSSQDGVLFNKDKTALILYPEGKTDTSYQVPDGVKIIGSAIFALVEVSLPDSLEVIGSYTFAYTTNLQTVNISPNSQLKVIGSYAFSNCSSLTIITIPETVTSIEDRAFSGCSALAIVYNNSSLNIIAGGTDNGGVGQYAKEVVTADNPQVGSIETIDNVNYYVNETKNQKIALAPAVARDTLTSVTLASDTTEINQYAFQYCSSLQTVDLNNCQITSIPDYAFGDCSSLTTITIPETVKTIERFAFGQWGLQSLTIVTIEGYNIYESATSDYACGYLLQSATTVKVPTTIVNSYDNSYLESSNFTTGTEMIGGVEYTVFTKVGA